MVKDGLVEDEARVLLDGVVVKIFDRGMVCFEMGMVDGPCQRGCFLRWHGLGSPWHRQNARRHEQEECGRGGGAIKQDTVITPKRARRRQAEVMVNG